MVNEETNRNNIFLMDQTANPAPLGLCAFGTTTILLSLWNAGVIGITSPIFAMAIFYGGLAQIIAGLMEWKKNNNFGFLTFVSFGFFWMTFAGVLMLPALGLAKAPQPVDLAAFLAVWGIVAFGLLVCTLNMHRSLQVTVLAVFLTIVLLVAAELTESGLVKLAGGLMGLLAGVLAIYIGLAQVINEVHNRKIIPV
ncbi:acetate uptake transporter [Methanoregula sp.]|uniref:acetate uptake transporter n=1 Tax=Methanoregula sp. TaxID=2052170 RepID=UPI002BC9448B|nr:acetate uptake transporter [Methanoregula sp.]HVP95736.1 acetate uptake transporter [Methanoregula sp.]